MNRALVVRLIAALLAGSAVAFGGLLYQTRRTTTIERRYDMPATQVRQFLAASTQKLGWTVDPTDLGAFQTPNGRIATEVAGDEAGASVTIAGPAKSAQDLQELLDRQLPAAHTGE